MPKTIDAGAIVNLPGATIDEAADKLHIWDKSAGQDKYVTLNDIITRLSALQTYFTRAPDYDSGEQTVAVDTRLTLAHGLGAIPRQIEVTLRCKTADAGYSAGQEVMNNNPSDSTDDKGFVVVRDATNIEIVQGQDIAILNRTTFNKASLTEANWRWVVRAWT